MPVLMYGSQTLLWKEKKRYKVRAMQMDNLRGLRGIRRMDRIAGSRSVVRLRKRWIDTVKECFKKRGLDVSQARRMVQDRSEWWRFVSGNAWGVPQVMNPRP